MNRSRARESVWWIYRESRQPNTSAFSIAARHFFLGDDKGTKRFAQWHRRLNREIFQFRTILENVSSGIVRGHGSSNPLRDRNLDGPMQANCLSSSDDLTSLIGGSWSTLSGQRTEICTGPLEKVIVGRKCSRLVSKWYLSHQRGEKHYG